MLVETFTGKVIEEDDGILTVEDEYGKVHLVVLGVDEVRTIIIEDKDNAPENR